MHLNDQIGIVLMSERWHETVPISVRIGTMTAGALFVKDPLAQHQIQAIAGLRTLRRRGFIQVGRDIDPILWFPHFLARYDLVHDGAVAFAAGKIR